MNCSTTHSTLMFSFLAGAVAGAGVALLLAPDSGKATREAMRRKLHDADESLRELKGRLIHPGEEIREEVAATA